MGMTLKTEIIWLIGFPNRLQDWRCLWCKSYVHSHCKSSFIQHCSLGETRSATVPPTSLIKIKGTFAAVRCPKMKGGTKTFSYDMGTTFIASQSFWITDTVHVTNPLPGSSIVVFVNSKSGGGHGDKFLRRFKTILNPGQVFDIAQEGPTPGWGVTKQQLPLGS